MRSAPNPYVGQTHQKTLLRGCRTNPGFVARARLADDAAMLLERLRVRLCAQVMQQLRRAFHIGEEERHGAGGSTRIATRMMRHRASYVTETGRESSGGDRSTGLFSVLAQSLARTSLADTGSASCAGSSSNGTRLPKPRALVRFRPGALRFRRPMGHLRGQLDDDDASRHRQRRSG